MKGDIEKVEEQKQQKLGDLHPREQSRILKEEIGRKIKAR